MNEPADLRRARFTVAYDGTEFHGFAENRNVRTVVGELRSAIEKVVRMPVRLVGAGRTDAGVHAWGQVVSCDLPVGIDLEGLGRRINSMCGPEVAVRDVVWTDDPEFSARFSATYRHYRYHVLNTPESNPFVARTAWHVVAPLRVWAMQLACDPLIGEQDFTSFCRCPKLAEGEAPPSLARRVFKAEWKPVDGDVPGLLRFEIRANAFCHQMVRSLVGTLVRVGLGELHAGDMRAIMMQRDRTEAAQIAPPHGLVLWEVGYESRVGSSSPSAMS